MKVPSTALALFLCLVLSPGSSPGQESAYEETTLAGLSVEEAVSRVHKARRLFDDQTDLDRALTVLRSVEPIILEQGSASQKTELLSLMGSVCVYLDRTSEAIRYFERQAKIAQAAGSVGSEANALFNVINLKLNDPDAVREELEILATETLERAEATGRRPLQGSIHRVLGRLLEDAAGRDHLRRCIEIGQEVGESLLENHCQAILAKKLAPTNLEEAYRLADLAVTGAAASGEPITICYVYLELMEMEWTAGSPERGTAAFLAGLDVLESIRDSQTDDASRVGLIASWSPFYLWPSGRLYDEYSRTASEEDLALGFQIVERMRARLLLDSLLAGGAELPKPSETLPLRRKREEVLQQITRARYQILALEEGDPARAELETEMADLETENLQLRSEISALDPDLAALERPDFASLEEIQATLGADEALLSFQIAPNLDVYENFAGGTWLLVITREGRRVLPLKDGSWLEPAVHLYLGVIESRSGNEGEPAARLFDELFGEALGDLPPEIDKLFVVPDGVLHHLPFETLRSEADGAPLGATFQISRIPSATLWMRWRREGQPSWNAPALALVDPTVGDEPSATRDWVAAQGRPLGPLPHARREGKKLIRHLGGGSRLLMGERATEGIVKREDLGEFALLHFAAHAVTNDRDPQESAVLLAAGGGLGDDGLLRFREIVDLDLSGQKVILSACRSASGTVVRGEGVLGLARAFFEAGADAVVGSLWPLRDDEAAAFFDAFYRHLGKGLSLAGALSAAQRDRLAAGAPAAAWAGVVVLGDGSTVPFPDGLRAGRQWWPWAVGALILLGVLLYLRRLSP